MIARARWRLFSTESRRPREATAADPPPVFTKGQSVRLKDKPDRPRAVLAVEWHRHRQQYCFRVQTSSSDAGLADPSYWFTAQLIPA
jgi:hypothetical protein